MRKIVKYIIIILAIVIIIVGVLYIRSKNIKKPDIYKDGISSFSYKVYLLRYGFISHNEYGYDELDEIEKRGIVVTDKTESVVNRFNSIFFDESNDKYNTYKEEIQKLQPIFKKKYGIDSDNPLTAQWVYKNPKKSLEIVNACSEELNYEIFYYEPLTDIIGDSSFTDSSQVTSEKK